MSKKNRHNQNNQNFEAGFGVEDQQYIEVEVEEIPAQPEVKEQVAASAKVSSSSEESFFSLKRSGGGYAGSYVGAAAAAIGSGVSSLLSDGPLGLVDAGSLAVSAAAGFGAGKLVDSFIENEYARYAGAGAVGGGIGFLVGSFSQQFKASVSAEAPEVPVIETGAI